MNNYILFGHILKCKYIPAESVHPETFKGANQKYRPVPYHKLEKERRRVLKTGERYYKACEKLVKKEQKRLEKIKEIMGMEWEVDGYAKDWERKKSGGDKSQKESLKRAAAEEPKEQKQPSKKAKKTDTVETKTSPAVTRARASAKRAPVAETPVTKAATKAKAGKKNIKA
jgi:nucleolar protein 15